LFKDFWERFVESLKALSAKRQRTVYRLTLVKAWNVDELDSYAELVSLGKPDFIEIKVMRSICYQRTKIVSIFNNNC
jgi:tRNA wybutosine-synthesizing protein 1